MIRTHRLRTLVAAAGLMAALLLVACGDDDGTPSAPGGNSNNGNPPASVVTPTPGAGDGQTPGPGDSAGGVPPAGPGFPAFEEPPATTASANGASVETGIGTYCWTTMCVDKIGVPTRGSLTVSSGDTISVAVPEAAPRLNEAAAWVFEAVHSQTLDNGSEIWPYPGSLGESQEYAIRDSRVEVIVDLPPGLYVLAVSMYFEAGDVVYGVLLEVQ